MNPDAILPTLIYVAAFAAGVRSTSRLWGTYRAIAPVLKPHRRAIGRAFVVVAALIVVIAGWLGALSVRRILGFEPLGWSFVVSYLLAIPVLFLPIYLERVWSHIGQVASTMRPPAELEPTAGDVEP